MSYNHQLPTTNIILGVQLCGTLKSCYTFFFTVKNKNPTMSVVFVSLKAYIYMCEIDSWSVIRYINSKTQRSLQHLSDST